MYKNKSILAIVPARGGSKGIKKKNLKKINKISLIGHVGLILKKISFIDNKVLSTDNIDIKKEGIKFDIDVPFMRPKKISGDRVGDIEVLHHALQQSERYYKKKFDYVMMLQPTSPLRNYNQINNMIKKIIDNKYDSIWSISKIDLKYHPFKQLLIKNDKLKFYDQKNGSKIIARQQLSDSYIRNGICYIFARNLIKLKKLINKNSSYEIIDGDYINIDNLDDIIKAKELMKL